MFAILFYPHHIHIWQFKPKNICTIRVAKDFQKPYTPFFLVTHPLKMFPFGNIGKAQSFPKPQTFNYGSPVSNSPYTPKKKLAARKSKKKTLNCFIFCFPTPMRATCGRFIMHSHHANGETHHHVQALQLWCLKTSMCSSEPRSCFA